MDDNNDKNDQPSDQSQLLGNPSVQNQVVQTLDEQMEDEADPANQDQPGGFEDNEPMDIDQTVKNWGGHGDDNPNGPGSVAEDGAIGSQSGNIQDEWEK